MIDPACGSGHILVKAFDVLFEIYKSQGWQDNEIPELILRNNLYGLDICDRASQLAQFAVMMKAREYDRGIFNKVSELNICSIKDTNWLDYHVAQELMKGVKDEKLAKQQIELLQDTFRDAKEYGSIINVKGFDFEFWEERINYFKNLTQATLYTPIIRGRLWYSIYYSWHNNITSEVKRLEHDFRPLCCYVSEKFNIKNTFTKKSIPYQKKRSIPKKPL